MSRSDTWAMSLCALVAASIGFILTALAAPPPPPPAPPPPAHLDVQNVSVDFKGNLDTDVVGYPAGSTIGFAVVSVTAPLMSPAIVVAPGSPGVVPGHDMGGNQYEQYRFSLTGTKLTVHYGGPPQVFPQFQHLTVHVAVVYK